MSEIIYRTIPPQLAYLVNGFKCRYAYIAQPANPGLPNCHQKYDEKKDFPWKATQVVMAAMRPSLLTTYIGGVDSFLCGSSSSRENAADMP